MTLLVTLLTSIFHLMKDYDTMSDSEYSINDDISLPLYEIVRNHKAYFTPNDFVTDLKDYIIQFQLANSLFDKSDIGKGN